MLFLGSWRGTAWRHDLVASRHMNATQFLGFPLNGLAMVLDPLGDVILFGSISMFLGF